MAARKNSSNQSSNPHHKRKSLEPTRPGKTPVVSIAFRSFVQLLARQAAGESLRFTCHNVTGSHSLPRPNPDLVPMLGTATAT